MALFNKRRAFLCALNAEPAGPEFIQYLSGTGTQWIDTKYIPTAQTALEVTYKLTDGNTADSWFMIAGCFKPASQNVRFQIGFNYRTNQINAGYGAKGVLIYGVDSNEHTIMIDGFHKQVVFDDAVKSGSLTEGDLAQNSSSVYLFTTNQAGAVARANANIYDVKIYHKGVLERHFLPCLHEQTKRPAMYDTVQKKYYYNSGEGEFNVPE